MTSRGRPLREWLGRLPGPYNTTGVLWVNQESLVAAGVDAREVAGYRETRRMLAGQDVSLHGAAQRMRSDLTVLCLAWPDLTVRSGIGWALVAASLSRSPVLPNRIRLPADDVEVLVEPWVQAGRGEDGWLFAAAGLSPAEAREQVAAEIVDTDALATLAALRGVALPVA